LQEPSKSPGNNQRNGFFEPLRVFRFPAWNPGPIELARLYHRLFGFNDPADPKNLQTPADILPQTAPDQRAKMAQVLDPVRLLTRRRKRIMDRRVFQETARQQVPIRLEPSQVRFHPDARRLRPEGNIDRQVFMLQAD